MFEPISKFIKRNQNQDPNLYLAPQICFLAQEIIKKELADSASKIKVVSYQHGRLKLAAANSIVLYQLKMKQEKILSKLKKTSGLKRALKLIYTLKEG